MFPKDPRIELPKLRAAARGRPCILQIEDVCNRDWATCVLAHSNCERHGKGVSRKAHDIFALVACYACHAWYDGPLPAGWTSEERQRVFDRGIERQWVYWVREGVLVVGKR